MVKYDFTVTTIFIFLIMNAAVFNLWVKGGFLISQHTSFLSHAVKKDNIHFLMGITNEVNWNIFVF